MHRKVTGGALSRESMWLVGSCEDDVLEMVKNGAAMTVVSGSCHPPRERWQWLGLGLVAVRTKRSRQLQEIFWKQNGQELAVDGRGERGNGVTTSGGGEYADSVPPLAGTWRSFCSVWYLTLLCWPLLSIICWTLNLGIPYFSPKVMSWGDELLLQKKFVFPSNMGKCFNFLHALALRNIMND